MSTGYSPELLERHLHPDELQFESGTFAAVCLGGRSDRVSSFSGLYKEHQELSVVSFGCAQARCLT